MKNESKSQNKILYSFIKEGKGKWQTENDVVMGGRSESELTMTEEGRAQFSGQVSLENDGGFCSIHMMSEDNPFHLDDEDSSFQLMVNGDGKKYNFRVRTPNGKHLYGLDFSTKSGDEWETVSIPFDEMSARHHGEEVDVPNYDGEDILEMQLLIGNNKEESFEIEIESIGIR